MMSDATPDTPADPRAEAVRIVAVALNGDEMHALDWHGAEADRVVNALINADLLTLPDEGSLRSQASGTPADRPRITSAQAMSILHDLQSVSGPHVLASVFRQHGIEVTP